MRPFLAALLVAAGCASAPPPQPPPPPAPPGAPEVRAVRIRETILVDGVDNDAAWRECPETEVALEGKGPATCRVKAAVYRGTIFFAVRWRDSTRTSGGMLHTGPWFWYRAVGLGDRVGLTFPIVGPIQVDPDPSIPRLLDFWEWGAGVDRTNGRPGDYVLANPAASAGSRNGGSWRCGLSLWGDDMLETSDPRNFDDVQACGTWRDGEWAVEFARALTTGHAMDRDLSGLAEIPFLIEVGDFGDRHFPGPFGVALSPVLRLLLPPPEDPRRAPLPEPLGPTGTAR
jgi:hypothetical protein